MTATRVAVCARTGCASEVLDGSDLCEHHLDLQERVAHRLHREDPPLKTGALHRVKPKSDLPSARTKWEGNVGLKGPQVVRMVGISYRQLDYWARTELVVPSVSVARGSGTQRRYSSDDVALLLLVRHMLDAGQSLPSCRVLLDRLRLGVHWPAWAVLSAENVDTDDDLDRLLADAPSLAVVINLARIRDEALEATA